MAAQEQLWQLFRSTVCHLLRLSIKVKEGGRRGRGERKFQVLMPKGLPEVYSICNFVTDEPKRKIGKNNNYSKYKKKVQEIELAR